MTDAPAADWSDPGPVTVAPGANGMLGTVDVEVAAGLIAASSVLVAQLEIPLEAVAAAAIVVITSE